MTYIAKTFSYIKKSFWVLLLIAVVPAVLLGLFVRPLGFVTFIPDFAVSAINSYADIAWLIFDRHATVYVYPLLLIFVTLTVCMALALSVIEKHFRTGKLMLKAPLRDLNSSLFPMLKTLAFIIAVYMLFKFILSGLVTLLHFLLSGAGHPNTLTVILVSISIIIAFVISIYFSVPIMFWAPLIRIFFCRCAHRSCKNVEQSSLAPLYGSYISACHRSIASMRVRAFASSDNCDESYCGGHVLVFDNVYQCAYACGDF